MQYKQRGFTLLEALVVLVAGGILIAVSANMFVKFRAIHQQQQRVLSAERELSFIRAKLSQALTTLPGRQLGYFNGINYAVATKLPANGTMTGANGTVPIELGFVTPFKVNGNDAITILAGSHDTARLELAEPITATTNPIIARVAIPGAGSTKPTLGSGALPPLKVNDLVLIVGSNPIYTSNLKITTTNFPATARLLKVTTGPDRKSLSTTTSLKRDIVEIGLDPCNSGPCSSLFPNLMNTKPMSPFALGSAIVKLTLISFYIADTPIGKQLMRNEGGAIVPDPSGNGYQVVGGKNSTLGYVDSLTIAYQMTSSSTSVSTPLSLSGFAYNGVTAVDVTLTRKLAPAIGQTEVVRTLTTSYPVRALLLQDNKKPSP